jgi:hypothetical protein
MEDDPIDKEASYQVGYGKPPEHSRFKPGQSGNPKGKRKGQKGFTSIARAALNEKVSVRTARGEKRITKLEALIHTSLNNALKGNLKAVDQVLKIAREVGLADEAADALDPAKLAYVLSDEDQAILKRFEERQRGINPQGSDE